MSVGLRIPASDLAGRILGVAPYARRFRVGRLVPPVGITSSDIRGLHELCLHLAPDDRSLPGVNMASLAGWIESVIGDDELARGVEAIAGSDATYVEKCERLHELVGFRLAQAREVVGGEPAE